MSVTMERQRRLPLSKAIRIAWKNIRIRWLRSLLVTSGIILALAFLMYILCSDAMARFVAERGSADLVERLLRSGVLGDIDDADKRAQTWWMVGLALLISFVGILNAMVMSVTERFREIGTMKCLGALDAFIIKLYLLESLFQGMVGTTIGIVLGLALAVVEGLAVFGTESVTVFPPVALAQLIGLCMVAGMVLTVAGALYPAWRAAKMQPVDAMRADV